MLRFVLDLPLWVTGPGLALLFAVLSLAGLQLARRWAHPRLHIRAEDSEFVGTMVQGTLVFYGLALALIAVSVWESYSQASATTSEEATTLAALYRDVSTYPDPVRTTMQGHLKGYTQYVIEEAWPAQRHGQIPTGGLVYMNRLQQTLAAFQPANDGQGALHAETLRAYNLMIHARRMRLDQVNSGLPGVMWTVILIGAVICLASTFFFAVQDIRLHGLMVALLAIFIALVIFMILSLDHPFQGKLGITPASYELIYEQLMKN